VCVEPEVTVALPVLAPGSGARGGIVVVRVGVVLLVCETVEDDAEHAGAHVLQCAEAICELLQVKVVGCGDHQCAAGDLREDRRRPSPGAEEGCR